MLGIKGDCLVNTACPRITYDDQINSTKSILSPNEVNLLENLNNELKIDQIKLENIKIIYLKKLYKKKKEKNIFRYILYLDVFIFFIFLLKGTLRFGHATELKSPH